jgi:hypothetical protein
MMHNITVSKSDVELGSGARRTFKWGLGLIGLSGALRWSHVLVVLSKSYKVYSQGVSQGATTWMGIAS